MANWRYKLNLKNVWGNEETTITEKAEGIATRIKSTFHFLLNPLTDRYDDELEDIVIEFEWLAKDNNSPVYEFDYIMEQLYDWGDQEVEPLGEWPPNRMCWIATIV